jgi:LacI family transcriptional regulator
VIDADAGASGGRGQNAGRARQLRRALQEAFLRHPKHATLADVAAAAGVDRSTASRVLNSDAAQRVGADTRKRVLDCAKQLGYQPNALARGLRSARSYTLAITVPQLENPVFPEIIFGAEKAAQARGYALLISHSEGTGSDVSAYEQLAKVSRVDGLLVATLEEETALARSLAKSTLPCVVLNRRLAGVANFVVFDSFAAARVATEHLLSLGHRRIGHLSGRDRGYNSRERLAGYRAALESAGITFDPALVAPAGYTFEGGQQATRELFARRVRPTGLVAATLLTAAGALRALHAQKIRVPEEVSVVSIHDAAIAEMLEPRLSTVGLPLQEMGARAADGLIDLIENKTQRVEHVLAHERLVVRESTGPAPGPRAVPSATR